MYTVQPRKKMLAISQSNLNPFWKTTQGIEVWEFVTLHCSVSHLESIIQNIIFSLPSDRVDWDTRGESGNRLKIIFSAWETFLPYVPIHLQCPNPPCLTVSAFYLTFAPGCGLIDHSPFDLWGEYTDFKKSLLAPFFSELWSNFQKKKRFF